MTAYYNEIDPYAAQWLRNLIDAGHIAPGVVDERSIHDVKPSELKGYTQCHFFAGLGGWSYALRRAGWADDRPVWTGSCPCQPFSSAGLAGGFADERHLWPFFHFLIEECGPGVVFGEQVASKDGLAWLDLVQTDLEGAGYAFGAVDLCAAGVGAPHIRQRSWFVAERLGNSCSTGLERGDERTVGDECETFERRGGACGLADTLDSTGQREEPRAIVGQLPESAGALQAGRIATDATDHLWRAADWLFCRDGKWRPVEPGTSPLAHGAPARVGRLRAYGNAINVEAAKVFIESYLETRPK
jgi:DNA (cytosine-5)-methyltransferase 1